LLKVAPYNNLKKQIKKRISDLDLEKSKSKVKDFNL